jgi:hypothetical protein
VKVATHIAHTWGDKWKSKDQKPPSCRFVIASDILLYYHVYDKLVQTIVEIFNCGAIEFVMAWNRRIEASATFFAMMKDAGFSCIHHGKCVYSFTRN